MAPVFHDDFGRFYRMTAQRYTYAYWAKHTVALQRCNYSKDSLVAGASMMHRAREATRV